MTQKTRQAPPERFFGYYPGTVAVITAAYGGVRNIMSAGWHSAVSIDPPMYGVAVGTERATHPLITQSGQFVVNFLPFAHAETIAAVGSVSFHDGFHDGEDKFARFGVETESPLVVAAPIVSAAYLSYECVLTTTTRTGDHDWFVGEVCAVHYDAAAFADRGMLEPHHTEAAIYFGRAEYMALRPENPRKSLVPAAAKKR